MSKNPETANLTKSELRQIVNDDGEDLQRIISNMQLLNSNIVGSNAYFYKHCRSLEGLIEAYGCPRIWLTFSVADNFWCDLHRLLGSTYMSNYFELNEKEKLCAHLKIIRCHPHLVDEYFTLRVKDFLDVYFSKRGLDVDYYWFRIEYQMRGTGHVHGCSRLNSDPGCSELGEFVRDTRITERNLRLKGIDCAKCYNLYDFHRQRDVLLSIA